MRPTNQSLHGLLERIGSAAEPDVDPNFSARLEQRLQNMDRNVTPLRPAASNRRRWDAPGWRPALAVAAVFAAVVVAGTIGSLPSAEPASHVRTLQPGSQHDVTSVRPATTVTAPAPTATFPVRPAPPASTPASTPVSEPRSTPASIGLTCTVGRASPKREVACVWTQTNAPDFKKYSVLRSGDGRARVLFTTDQRTITTYTDTTVVAGPTYDYVVVALRADGTTTAHSTQVLVTVRP
jgi:hypothetical protein